MWGLYFIVTFALLFLFGDATRAVDFSVGLASICYYVYLIPTLILSAITIILILGLMIVLIFFGVLLGLTTLVRNRNSYEYCLTTFKEVLRIMKNAKSNFFIILKTLAVLGSLTAGSYLVMGIDKNAVDVSLLFIGMAMIASGLIAISNASNTLGPTPHKR